MELLIEISGWLGTILIVWAYYLVSVRKLDILDQTYQVLNLVGAFFLGVTVFYKQAWPALALEIIWAAIALYALWNINVKKSLEKEDR